MINKKVKWITYYKKSPKNNRWYDIYFIDHGIIPKCINNGPVPINIMRGADLDRILKNLLNKKRVANNGAIYEFIKDKEEYKKDIFVELLKEQYDI